MSEIPIFPKIENSCKQAFLGNSELSKLSYYELEMLNGKLVLKPLREVLDEGVKTWSSSLVGQVVGKQLDQKLIYNIVN